MEKSMETVYEREFIVKSPSIHFSGFTNRAVNRLATARLTPDILNIETNHESSRQIHCIGNATKSF